MAEILNRQNTSTKHLVQQAHLLGQQMKNGFSFLVLHHDFQPGLGKLILLELVSEVLFWFSTSSNSLMVPLENAKPALCLIFMMSRDKELFGINALLHIVIECSLDPVLSENINGNTQNSLFAVIYVLPNKGEKVQIVFINLCNVNHYLLLFCF